MKLNKFFQKEPKEAFSEIRPTRPTSEKVCGTAQNVAAVSASHTSHTSHLKTEKEIAKLEQGNFPQTRPKRCYLCDCWGKGGGAYWIGRCTITGARLDLKSRCTIGFIEPVPQGARA